MFHVQTVFYPPEVAACHLHPNKTLIGDMTVFGGVAQGRGPKQLENIVVNGIVKKSGPCKKKGT